MAAYLITHSLLSSWLHLIRENPYEDLTTEGDPLAEFMLVLKREPTPRTEAMQNGIDFENLVTAIVNGHDDPNNPWSWAAGQIAAIVNGGQLQFKARRKIQVRGMDVVLYGRLDKIFWIDPMMFSAPSDAAFSMRSQAFSASRVMLA